MRSNDAHPAPWSVASIANLKQLEIGRQIPPWVSRQSSASFPAGTRSRTPSCSCRRRSPVTTVFAVEYRLFPPSCMYIVTVPNFIMRRASNSNSTYFAPSSLVLMAAQTATRAPWLDHSAAHAIVHLFSQEQVTDMVSARPDSKAQLAPDNCSHSYCAQPKLGTYTHSQREILWHLTGRRHFPAARCKKCRPRRTHKRHRDRDSTPTLNPRSIFGYCAKATLTRS